MVLQEISFFLLLEIIDEEDWKELILFLRHPLKF